MIDVCRVADRVSEACGVSVWASGAALLGALLSALQHGGAATLRLHRPRAARATLRLPDARGLALAHGE